MVATQILGVDSFAYWKHSRDFVESLDIFAGVFKSYFFGAAIALISCHRGFNSSAGAEGVGQGRDRGLCLLVHRHPVPRLRRSGLGWNTLYRSLWPQAQGLL